MRRSLIALGTIGAMLVLALAGCGGDSKADPSASSSPSAPVTSPASTTPTPPAMPAAAKADTKAGAIAFVRHYIDLINYAQATGDVEALAAVEDVGCKSCADGRHYLQSVYQGHGHIAGGALSITTRDALKNASVHGWTIDGSLRYGPQTVVQPTMPTPTQHLKGGGVLVTVITSFAAGRWTVAEWTRAQ
jgi:hypothetical protein